MQGQRAMGRVAGQVEGGPGPHLPHAQLILLRVILLGVTRLRDSALPCLAQSTHSAARVPAPLDGCSSDRLGGRGSAGTHLALLLPEADASSVSASDLHSAESRMHSRIRIHYVHGC